MLSAGRHIRSGSLVEDEAAGSLESQGCAFQVGQAGGEGGGGQAVWESLGELEAAEGALVDVREGEPLGACLTTPIRYGYADQGFAGRLVEWTRTALRTTLDIVRKPADQRGFAVHPAGGWSSARWRG